jgi:hypothetical protein
MFAHAADRALELLSAAANGETAHVKTLLEAGVDVESKDKNGRTPLMLAAQHGHVETVRLLLSKGANAKARDKAGWTTYGLTLDPTGGAFHKQHEAVLKILPPPAPVRTAVDTAWNSENLISSCFMTRDQLIAQVEQMHLDALILSEVQAYASALGNGVLQIASANRRGLAPPSQPEISTDLDASVSVEVRPGAACGQAGDTLNLAIDVRVFRARDLVLKETFGGGLKGLEVRTVANPAQYIPFYDEWVTSHAGQVFRSVLSAALKSTP